jgi:hypothetical protein
MCDELYHDCKICGRHYRCEEPNWVCPTLNFDENAEMCEVCEKNYYEEMIALAKEQDEA